MTTKNIVKILFLIFTISNIHAQIAINEDGSAPDASAMLHVESWTKGEILTSMTSTQRMANEDPSEGLLVNERD